MLPAAQACSDLPAPAPVHTDGSATYTPGISEKRGSTTKFYGQDVKNGVAQVSTFQTISASKQYDAFGNVTNSSGTWNGPFSYGGKFGYQSDADTSYQLLGHRYYDSTTGRFLTRDPIGDGRNWYSYCGNNPVKLADPAGDIPLLVIPLIGFLILCGTSTNDQETTPEGIEAAGNANVEVLSLWVALFLPVERVIGLSLKGLGAVCRPIALGMEAGVSCGAKLSGQLHHAISRMVHNALQRHPKLAGKYKYKDPRFTARAVDKAAHNGYGEWHRELDKEVRNWLDANQGATAKQFENYLRALYKRKDLKQRFPGGLQ